MTQIIIRKDLLRGNFSFISTLDFVTVTYNKKYLLFALINNLKRHLPRIIALPKTLKIKLAPWH